MSWEYVTLDKLGSITRGRSKHRPRNAPELFGGKYPFIQTADVKSANFYITEYTNTYNDKGLAQSKLWPKNTLCITIAANIADTAILGIEACFPDSIMGFIPYEKVSDVRFVKYCFDILQRNCKQISQGTAQDNLSWEKLSTIKFPMPKYEEQVRIANILSSYDDLIENNQKQIKLLEEAAQRLYKEWFVDFRFPGHENTTFIDGLPEGWKKDKAENLFEITIGKTPPRSESKWFTVDDIGVPWASISDMGASNTFLIDTNEKLVNEAIKKHNIKIVPIGTVLVSFKLTVGKVCITAKEMCTNEAIAHFYINKPNTRFYTYLYLNNFHYEILGNTSSISKAVNSKIIKSMPFIMPDEKLLDTFSGVITPIFKMMENKCSTIKILTEARDRLLPKLMSGEIEV